MENPTIKSLKHEKTLTAPQMYETYLFDLDIHTLTLICDPLLITLSFFEL